MTLVEVVFHVGAHKSATTSVQRGLEALAARRPGLAYVGPIGRDGPDATNRALADFVDFTRRARGHAHDAGGVADGLCRLIEAHRDASRLVISDENILGGMPGVARRFYPRSAEVRTVLDAVASRFPTSAFLQSRETVGFLESCRRFRVMQGAPASRTSFLETFDLDSASWASLGASLFDGARYRWRVLPIERLADPARRRETEADLSFLVPRWDLAETPLESVNVSRGPLVRAALLALNAAGDAPARPLRNAITRSLSPLEAAVARADPEAAVAMISAAFAEAGRPVETGFARIVHGRLGEETSGGPNLTETQAARLADDYAGFLARYAAPGGR